MAYYKRWLQRPFPGLCDTNNKCNKYTVRKCFCAKISVGNSVECTLLERLTLHFGNVKLWEFFSEEASLALFHQCFSSLFDIEYLLPGMLAHTSWISRVYFGKQELGQRGCHLRLLSWGITWSNLALDKKMAAMRGMIKRTHIIIRVNDRLAMQKSVGKESEKEWIYVMILIYV